MNGLELSKAYYEKYGKPMIEKEFPEYADRIAVGLVGPGSECFGFDDEISRDHDFEPSFYLWLTDEDEKEIGFRLHRAYQALPKDFMNIKIQKKSRGRLDGRGVRTISEFYQRYLFHGVPKTYQEWLMIPEHALAEVTNGEVFKDSLGAFSSIRNVLKEGYPEDVRMKKIGSYLFLTAQSGQYNYKRCMSHGETMAATQALAQFCAYAAKTVLLLKKQYIPYYKWLYRLMRQFPLGQAIELLLQDLLKNPMNVEKNVLTIETICSLIIEELKKQGLTMIEDPYLEAHAVAIQDRIQNADLRNDPIVLPEMN